MSYILDALKKSERQRPQGPVPDLFTIQGPQPPEKRRRTAAARVAALAVALVSGCVVALGIWAWSDGPGRRPAAPPAPVSPERPAPAASMDRAEVVPVAPPQPPPRAGTTARHGAATVRPAVSGVPVKTPRPGGRNVQSPPTGPSPAQPAPAPVVASQESKVAAGGIAPSPTAGAEPLAAAGSPAVGTTGEPLAESAGLPVPPPAAESSPTAVVPSASAVAPDLQPPSPGVVDLDALPAPVRSELPALGITGHVWSEEGSLRLLSVQDRIVREGGEAAPGVRLEEITQTGAVFVFRGWRFRVPGF